MKMNAPAIVVSGTGSATVPPLSVEAAQEIRMRADMADDPQTRADVVRLLAEIDRLKRGAN